MNTFPKVYQQQCINNNKLLEKIKELIKSENYSLAKLYLFLLKLNNESKNFEIKIQIIYYLSEIAAKEKNEKESIKLGHKIISLINKLDMKKYNEEIILSFILILINSSEICENNNIMLSCWFLFTAKNVYIENYIKDEYINEKITTKFPIIINKCNKEINSIRDNIMDNKNNIIRLCDEVKKYFKNKNNEIIYKNLKKGQKFFIVNKKWVQNFYEFINEIFPLNKYKNKNELDLLFQINSICISYFNVEDSNTLEKEDIKGIFCGKINNFNFVKLKNFWPDQEENFTNIYINKSSLEKEKILILEEEKYKKVKFYIGANFEIERIKNDVDENMNNDIELLPFKILFINEEMRYKHKDQIIIKYMQINKNSNISDLISKIKRGFVGFLKENKFEIVEYEYKIYLLNYNAQDIINIILNYINMIKYYRIKGELINNEEYIKNYNISKMNLEDLLKNKFICCEVLNKNSIVTPFLTLKLFCPKCYLTLDKTNSNNKYYPCGFCSLNLYCSEKCKNSDYPHIQFHSNLSIICDNNIKSSIIENINIDNFIDKNSRNGLVGLIDSGGNDFLLSCIQALSSCEIFTKFILTQCNKYLDNNYISKEKNLLISSFTGLIAQMWKGTEKIINPSRFCQEFFSQIQKLKLEDIDALDALTFLLDKFHEELNEYKNKSSENIDFFYKLQNENDKIASLRWIKTFKSINESIIVDLFYGQLKETLLCPNCCFKNISYPFFTCLNLPIPSNRDSKIKFRVFPYSNHLFNFVEISFFIDNLTTILELKNKIKGFKMFSKSNLEALIYENDELTGILSDNSLVYDYIYQRQNFNEEVFNDYEITFIEKPIEEFNNIYIYTIPVIFEEQKGFFSSKKNIIALTYCKLFYLRSECNIKELEKEIFKYYRRAIDNKYSIDSENNVDDSYYIEFYQKLNDEKYIEEEFNKYLLENEPLEIYIYHNLPKEDGWIFSGPRCEFCGYTACQKKFCKFEFHKDMKIKEIKNKLNIERPIILLINFKKYEHMFSIFYQSYIDKNDPRMLLNEEINIYDCFELFTKKKKLKEEKNYICLHCNKNLIPSQIKTPYISPKYLIISFNRIQKDFDNLLDILNNKKDETPIGYPIENFDISEFFIGNNKNNNLYNLIAVILHIGDIKKASYKTLIKNKDSWYEIKGQNLEKINLNEVINSNAYILFYEKKGVSIDLMSNFEEKEKNFDINIDLNIIKNDIRFLKKDRTYNRIDYYHNYDEKIPLKNKIKVFGKMKDI